MNKKDMEEFEEMIEVLSNILNVKKSLEARLNDSCSKKADNCDCEEEKQSCSLLAELEKDYKDIIFWAVGISGQPFCKKKSCKYWEKAHTGLPIPRILKSKNGLDLATSIICLLIDVVPLYFADKKKCAG